LAPGKKWFLPMQALCEAMSDYVKIAPVSDETYEKKIINWSSIATQKLLEFDDKYFIQTLIEKEPINIINNNLNSIDFVYNIVLLPTVTFYNYLPYPVLYEVMNNTTMVNMFLLITFLFLITDCIFESN
jgi:hypothetical protein